ncbi:hypothetical protein SOV_17490 [Sporomusa ovata DSM 2662]|uniref:Uncharacterized protein n=1 Tax=Sporomusa ovata TaxID=2378 RepID=A0A0U1KVN4_9FIRM|nr:hypothetical protein [Sporomusa ovata]EQB29349.1 hypothetical protein SOV_1c10820 [Sporomusa ovata DSM 2662]CQR71396.1 hypothetical protein SpAn4DRAFT_3901 [Sporomusa ovata]
MFSLTKRQAVILLGVVLLLVACWLLYQYFHQPQPVTVESQQLAETPAGVDLAAKNAHIDMLQSQLNEAAQQIAELKNKPPDTIIQTVPVEVIKTVEVERQKSGANFAIVTDPKQPDKQVDLKEVEKLPTETSVTLNQYNVFAYKKVIRGVNVYPDWSEVVRGNFKIDEVTADVSRRITKDGKYIGVVAGYDFKHDHAKAGLRYLF